MKKLLSQIAAGVLGLWLAVMFVPGVKVELLPDSNFFGIHLTAQWQIFLLLGIVLGLLNYFLKPILKALALPLEIITLGLFSFVINMGLVWLIDYNFKEFSAPILYPLLLTTLIVWGLNFVLSIIIKE